MEYIKLNSGEKMPIIEQEQIHTEKKTINIKES